MRETLVKIANQKYQRLGAFGMGSRHDEWGIYAICTPEGIVGRIVNLKSGREYLIQANPAEKLFDVPEMLPTFIQARARVVMKRLYRALQAE